VIGSTSTASPAFDLTGFPGGTIFTIVGLGVGNTRGRIQGAGGAGSPSALVSGTQFGAAGGGSGTVGGLGGDHPAAPESSGFAGTGIKGGAPGLPTDRAGGGSGAVDGFPGGLALATRGFAVTLRDIAVWGGGGGGAGSEGPANLFPSGGAGGDPGLPGGDTATKTGGAAGNAIDHDGSAPTLEGATDVRGASVA
jgi:hypothetical protein